MSSPLASNSPARSENENSCVGVRDDAFAGVPEIPGDESGQHDEDGQRGHADEYDGHGVVRDAFADVPEIPGDNFGQHEHADEYDSHGIARDAFADVPEIPGDDSGQYNDAGHHGHADDYDSHSIVRDAFSTLPPLPDNDFEPIDFGDFDFEHNDFGGNDDLADYIPGDFEQSLQLALGPVQDSTGPSAPTFDDFTAQPSNEPQVPDDGGSDGEDDPEDVAARILSGALSPGQQAGAVGRMSEHNMDKMYIDLMRSHGFRPADNAATVPATVPSVVPSTMPAAGPAAGPAAIPPGTLSENNYQPIAFEPELAADPNAPPPPPPIYPAYTGRFQSGPAARAYRKRNRVAPKCHAPDVERVKRYGRMYWVRRIYECMIDISNVSDSPNSIHRTRFAVTPAFNPLDLEAAAHHVFDEALAVHERGWNRPIVYHKKVVRGKLTDVSEQCLERRLARICLCLQQKKATVDDALRGGVTLALLCDNPEARGFTKLSNNAGNAKRGERLRAAKGVVVQAEVEEEDDEEEEEEEEEE